MKKFVATFQTKRGGKLYFPIHADDEATATLLAKKLENFSADFLGSKGLELVKMMEIEDDQSITKA